MRFDPFGWFAVRRLRDVRRERRALVEDYYRNEAAPMSPERRARILAHPATPQNDREGTK